MALALAIGLCWAVLVTAAGLSAQPLPTGSATSSPKPFVSTPRPALSPSPKPLIAAPRPSPKPLIAAPRPPLPSPKPLIAAPSPPRPSPKPLVAAPQPAPTPLIAAPRPSPKPLAVAPKPSPTPLAAAPRPSPKPLITPPKPTPKPMITPPTPIITATKPLIVAPRPSPKPLSTAPRPPAPRPTPAVQHPPDPRPSPKGLSPAPRPSPKPLSDAPRPPAPPQPAPVVVAKPAPLTSPRPSPRPPSPAPPSTPTTGNTTILFAARSSFCLTPGGGSTAVLSNCDGSVKQLWTWNTVDKTLINAANGLCLTYAAALANGSAVTMQNCSKPLSALQQWSYSPNKLAPVVTVLGKAWCLHVSNDSVTAGGAVKIWSCFTAQYVEALAPFFLWGLYAPRCSDLDTRCPAWAQAGRCTSQALAMVGNATNLGTCLVSCNACPVASPAPPPTPPSPPPRPPTPPSTMRPPRNGGAQGGLCWSSCPNGYAASNGVCVRPAQSYFKGCGCVTVWGVSVCCRQCPSGWSESTWTCSLAADTYPLCVSPPPPPRPPPPPNPVTDPRYMKTLWRQYMDGAGVLRPGWKSSGLTYTDGNVFLATMIMTQMPQVYHETTPTQAAIINQNCTTIMAPAGAIGPLQWWKVTWDRDFSGAPKVMAGGSRTARALVFRTNTDVFVWIPGTDAGAISFDLPDDPIEILNRFRAGSFGFGTGDWATNFEATSYQRLDPIGVDIARGFYDMFRYILVDELTARITAKIQEMQPGWQPGQFTDVKVFFMGHSQGAAMAGISAAYFNALGYPLGGAYLFADPAPTRFGDATMRSYFFNNGLWNKVFRILNSNDVVPMLPPGNWHVGRTIMFCQDSMQTWDDYGQGSPTCSADIGAVVMPSGSGLDYIRSLANMVDSIHDIIDQFSSVIRLHEMVFYASNALRAFSKQTSADMVSLLSPAAWPRIWLTPYCLSTSQCNKNEQCGVLAAAKACGSGYQCGSNFQCYLPPPPPPPCTTWWGGPCW